MKLKYLKILFSIGFSISVFTVFAWDTPVVLEPANGVNTWNVVYFDWETVVASDYYELQIDTAPGFTSAILFDSVITYVDASGNGDTWAYVDDLLFGTTYYWRLRAYGSSTYSSWSSVRSFTTSDIVELSSPLSNSQNYTRVKIDWNSHPGVFFYDYELDTTSNFDPPLIAGTDTAFSEYNVYYDTEENILNLFFGKTYYWRVRARNNVDYSQWAMSSFNTYDEVVISSPPDSSVEFTGMTIDWQAFDGIILYQYELDTSLSFNSPAYITGTDTFILFENGNTDTEVFIDNLYFGVNYYWRLRAINLNDTSSWSQAKIFSTLNNVEPDMPQNNTLTFTGTEIDWLAHAGADFYDYQIDTTSAFNSPALVTGYTVYINPQSDNNDTKAYIEDLYFGKTCYWRIRARNAVDTSTWSEVRNFITIDSVTLIDPGNLTIFCTGLTFTWEEQPGISSYTLQLDTNSTFTSPALLEINSLTVPQYYLQDLYFGKEYHWRLRAFNNNDASEWSSPNIFYTWDQIGLLLPLDGALNQSTSGVTLDWLSHTGAMLYSIEMDVTNMFNSPGLVQQSNQYMNSNPGNPDTEFNTSPLLANTFYFWRVKITNQVDVSKWEERWFSTGNVPLTLPGTPTLIQPLLGELYVPVNAVLIWSAVPGATGYYYQISTNPDFDNAMDINSTSAFAAVNLSYHTTYFWRVRAFDGTLASNWSLVYHFITEIEQLTVPVLNGPPDLSTDMPVNAVTLDWNDVANVNYYVVEYSTFEDFLFNLTTQVTYVSQYSIPLLEVNSTYYWRVKAVNDTLINSDWSEVWSFTTENDLNVPLLVSPPDNSFNIPVTDVTLNWNDVPLATGYQLEYATDFDFASNLIIENTIVSQFTISQLDYFETYYWRVKATADTIIASGWSQAWSFSTMADTNSIAETEMVNIQIYPNPTNGLVYFNNGNDGDAIRSVTVTDIAGKELIQYYPEHAKAFSIDLGNLSDGLYFMRFENVFASYSRKILLLK